MLNLLYLIQKYQGKVLNEICLRLCVVISLDQWLSTGPMRGHNQKDLTI
jgi:hypothetical protein